MDRDWLATLVPAQRRLLGSGRSRASESPLHETTGRLTSQHVTVTIADQLRTMADQDSASRRKLSA